MLLKKYVSESVTQTERLGERLGKRLHAGDVVAMFGGMGMGKTAFTRGLARGLGIDPALVSSPTFALVHVYNGKIPLHHYDMYRIETWDDLYSTGFFEDLECGGIRAVEWSENIENALPETAIRLYFERGETDAQRILTVMGGAALEDPCD